MFEQHPDWAQQASAKYRDMAELGRRAAGFAAVADRRARQAAAPRECQRVRRFDVIVMPSTAALPWPAGEAYPTSIDGQAVGPRGHAIYTGWVNAAGLPGLALPTAPSAEGLPIGLQLIGAYGSDDALLDLGEVYEAVAPWADRWPDL